MRFQPRSIDIFRSGTRKLTNVADGNKPTGKLILFIFREYRAYNVVLPSY